MANTQSDVKEDVPQNMGPIQGLPDISLQHLFSLKCECKPPKDLGVGPYGKRMLFDIVGGTFFGPHINGVVLSGGADWCIHSSNGSSYIDTRYNLMTDDGVTIFIQTSGVGSPLSTVSHLLPPDFEPKETLARPDRVSRLVVKLETGHPKYEYLTRFVIIAAMEKVGDWVSYNAYAVL